MIYVVCLLGLAAVVALFFGLARGFRDFGVAQRVLRVVIVLPLVISGTAHLAMPAAMVLAIPPVFPARTFLVIVSGLAELCGAAGLLLPALRRQAALAIALLMIAVFPVNIYVAGRTMLGLHMPSVTVRLAMQVIYILLVLVAGWGWPVLRRQ